MGYLFKEIKRGGIRVGLVAIIHFLVVFNNIINNNLDKIIISGPKLGAFGFWQTHRNQIAKSINMLNIGVQGGG